MAYELNRLLGGCDGTLSGWHVPEKGRGYVLLPDGQTVPLAFALMGVMQEVESRYVPNDRPHRARCLCGWTPPEEVIVALAAMLDEALGMDLHANAHRYESVGGR